ncbi:MAG TPA: peroxiredoxin [Polyangia bacterium]|jgi:peroxiredoxin Q/BCP|nr:peroxiredoxin [Polyangia bacterium]
MSASRPKVGGLAPDFTLPAADGTAVNLAELCTRKIVVLYFYPKDETAGCTVEACTFRDAYEDFVSAGAEVVGVSRDDQSSHQSFARGHRLPFVLLSDPQSEVHDLYGVRKRMAVLLDRVTFVIDRHRIVRHEFSSMINMRAHITEALAVVRRLQTAPAP